MSQERKPERVRDEKINGVIYDMSPAPAYQHSQVIGQIFAKIKNGLKGSMCLVFMENIDYKYSRDNDDYLEPDLIICCDRSAIRGNSYYSTPKFVAEAISPSTVKRESRKISMNPAEWRNTGFSPLSRGPWKSIIWWMANIGCRNPMLWMMTRKASIIILDRR